MCISFKKCLNLKRVVSIARMPLGTAVPESTEERHPGFEPQVFCHNRVLRFQSHFWSGIVRFSVV
jgi:hypothetical protein